MLFNSYVFLLVFLPAVIAGYYVFAHSAWHGAQKTWLLMASLFFYGWWNPACLYLLVASVSANFLFSSFLTRGVKGLSRQHVFILAIFFNVALLGYFKYANFFVENISSLFGVGWSIEKIILPLAISFFTMQQIAYQVDVYEGLVEEKSFLDYALFVCFFPQLIAGPIVHHKEMMPQFRDEQRRFFDQRNFALGFFVFTVGLFKKVVLADSFSVWVNAGYGMSDQLSMLDAWVSSLSYTFQMYFDFSGYADMAIGLGLMFNIKIPENFNSPYRATSVINYWERWHITLSRFINVYVYTPILRSFSGRITFAKAMVATLAAMLISGLWHGAAWTFILWGVVHGLALVVNHSWRRLKIKLPIWFAWGLTFLFVNISLVIFRSENIEQMLQMMRAMIGLGSPVSAFSLQVVESVRFDWGVLRYLNELPQELWPTLALLGALALCLLGKNTSAIQKHFKPNFMYLLMQFLLFFIPLLMLTRVQEFIYFNF